MWVKVYSQKWFPPPSHQSLTHTTPLSITLFLSAFSNVELQNLSKTDYTAKKIKHFFIKTQCALWELVWRGLDCDRRLFICKIPIIQPKFLCPAVVLLSPCSLCFGSQSFQPEDLPDHSLIQETASAIVGTLSKRHNSTIMLAVIEVKVETQVMPPSVGKMINKGVPQGFVIGPHFWVLISDFSLLQLISLLFLYFLPLCTTDYLVPLLCVLFCLLCLFCMIVCIWWTRKRRKERERTSQSSDDNVNNQWEPLRLVVGRQQQQQLKESNREAEQERKKLMGPSCRTCDEGEEEEEEEEETEGELELEEECGGAEAGKQLVYSKYSKTAVQSSGGVICTLHSSSSSLKAPHRTQGYSPKDNRWKNVSAVLTGQKELRDHCV